jgi:tRNA(fMet)-specific endonuclease VapC
VKYLLDTNTCIYIINERPVAVLERFKKFVVSDLGVSSVTVGELAFGVAKSRSARNRSALEAFLLPLSVAPFDLEAAFAYGDLRAELERRGEPIGPMDMQIAAHALCLKVTLVTNNEREFRKVPGLNVENWT